MEQKRSQLKPPKKAKQVYDGEWQKLPPIYFIKCCDCGLIHRLEFRLHKNRLQYRAWRVE